MNVMFQDRQFLLVPYPVGGEVSLIDRMILGNELRPNPFDLWFIDQRTIAKHQKFIKSRSIVIGERHAWAFYIPNRDCPLDYRELALWFVLWSVQPKHKQHYFQDSFSGLEKLTGLGQRQASEVADRLAKHGLIKVIRTEGWPWFYLFPYEDCVSWFQPTQASTIPPEILELEQQRLSPKPVKVTWTPEQSIIMFNEAIPSAVRSFGYEHAKQWWEQEVKATGAVPIFTRENAIEIQCIIDKLKPESEDQHGQHTNQQDEDGDDFIERLKRA